MTLTALRRPALVPNQIMPTVSFSCQSCLATHEADTSNRISPFVESLATYQCTTAFTAPPRTSSPSSSTTSTSFSSHAVPYSSWDVDTLTASTPRQNTPVNNIEALANQVLNNTADIDQWLANAASLSIPLTETTASAASNTQSLFSTSLNHINTSVVSQRPVQSKPIPFFTSREIVLRSLNGDPDLDIYYPQSTLLQAVDDNGVDVIVSGGLIEYSSPPIEDFTPENGLRAAKGQPEKRRCTTDIYTPLWVRGDGISREGWCSLCRPGRWLNLKTSQYLYHLQNTHGVIQTTGTFCPPPLQLRVYEDSVGTTEGLCGNCQQWISICTVRKKRSFSAWFEHARKCRGSVRRINLLHPHQNRRAMSSSPALRLRAARKEGHQRVRSLQEVKSFAIDFAYSPCSSTFTHKDRDYHSIESDSNASMRACCGEF